MGFLTLESILAANDLEAVEIEVPEWGGSIKARPLTALELEHIGREATGKDGTTDGAKAAKLTLAASLVEPKLKLQEIEALWAQKKGTVLVRLAGELDRLNGRQESEAEKERSFPGTGDGAADAEVP